MNTNVPDLKSALEYAKIHNAEFKFTYAQSSPLAREVMETFWKAGYLQGWIDRDLPAKGANDDKRS